tara:strand:- start:12846 stop:13085 length:240 start_codon:yes stop_codon:yes gene_type:complete
MNFKNSASDEVLFPITISVKAETVRLLSEMAKDMGISIDDVLSVLAEDAAIDLESECKSVDQTFIPDKCSRDDLLNALE